MNTQDSKPSIYEAMRGAAVPIDNHESDLYVPVNETSSAILAQYPERSRSVFVSQIDKQPWYDIPFAYEPWWQARQKRS